MRNNQKALFLQTSSGKEKLHWHFKLTVMENMCAKFLDKKEGANRMQWNSLFPPKAVKQYEMTDLTNLLGPKSSMDPLLADDKVAGLLLRLTWNGH